MGIGRSRRENRKARHTARPAAVPLPSPVSAIYRRFYGRSAPTPGILLCPSRQCRQEFSGESRKTEETSRSNLWRLGSCSVRRQQVAVGPADRQQVAPGTAWPATLAGVFRGSPENRRNQPLQSMAADFVFCPAAAGGCRPRRPAASGSGHCPAGASSWLSALPAGLSLPASRSGFCRRR